MPAVPRHRQTRIHSLACISSERRATRNNPRPPFSGFGRLRAAGSNPLPESVTSTRRRSSDGMIFSPIELSSRCWGWITALVTRPTSGGSRSSRHLPREQPRLHGGSHSGPVQGHSDRRAVRDQRFRRISARWAASWCPPLQAGLQGGVLPSDGRGFATRDRQLALLRR